MEASLALSPESPPEEGALAAYEALAPYYDELTHDYDHESWVADLERLARGHGLCGRRLLDVACGTGKSFVPMLARNYKVTACDLSPAMVARARERLGDRGEAAVADMRALPWRERFDLVTCLDDAVNYLLDPGDLTAALRSMRRALVPGGTLVFDVNTMRTYRSTFGSEFEVDSGSRRFRWSGAPVGARGPAPGGVFSARIEVLDGEGGARPSGGRHTQRHHPRPAVEASCRAAGLRVLDVRGLLPGGALDSDGDEDRHLKLIYVARRPPLRSASPRLHPASARAPRALPSSRKVHTRGGDRK